MRLRSPKLSCAYLLPSLFKYLAWMPRLLSSVTVRVPATSANLGPGFDCLGIALQLFNDVTLATVGADGAPVAAFAVTAVGEGADSLPLDATNLVARAATRGDARRLLDATEKGMRR